MRFIKRTVAVLVAVMMLFSTVSVSFFAKADTEEHHYLVFAFGMILISSGFVVSMLAISRRKRKDRS